MRSDYAPMVWVGVVAGLRWGEVAGLRVRHVDVLHRTVNVEEQVARGAGGTTIVAAPKSDAGTRTLTIPSQLADLLSAHMAKRGLTAADAEAFLFPGPDGVGPLAYSNWRRRIWQPAIDVAGLDGLGFHDRRRANATAMVLDKVDVKTAQTRLGHSDPRLTLAIYAQATQEGDEQAADKLGERFMPRTLRVVGDARANRGHDQSPHEPTRRPTQADLRELSGRRDSNPRPQRPEGPRTVSAEPCRTKTAGQTGWRPQANGAGWRRMLDGCWMAKPIRERTPMTCRSMAAQVL
jgi:hypothetical protein